MTAWIATCQALLSSTVSWSLLKLMSIQSVMLSNRFILCCPLLLLPSIFASIRVFSNELALWVRWPKYWSFSISPSNEWSGLISFRVDWFDLFTVQGTSPASIWFSKNQEQKWCIIANRPLDVGAHICTFTPSLSQLQSSWEAPISIGFMLNSLSLYFSTSMNL